MYYDVFGPMQVDSIGGNKYFISFIDDFSIKLWTFLIHKKSCVLEVFRKFKLMVERQSGHKLETELRRSTRQIMFPARVQDHEMAPNIYLNEE